MRAKQVRNRLVRRVRLLQVFFNLLRMKQLLEFCSIVSSNPIWGSDFFRVLQTFNLSFLNFTLFNIPHDLHYIALHYTTLHYIILHYLTIHGIL